MALLLIAELSNFLSSQLDLAAVEETSGKTRAKGNKTEQESIEARKYYERSCFFLLLFGPINAAQLKTHYTAPW